MVVILKEFQWMLMMMMIVDMLIDVMMNVDNVDVVVLKECMMKRLMAVADSNAQTNVL